MLVEEAHSCLSEGQVRVLGPPRVLGGCCLPPLPPLLLVPEMTSFVDRKDCAVDAGGWPQTQNGHGSGTWGWVWVSHTNGHGSGVWGWAWVGHTNRFLLQQQTMCGPTRSICEMIKKYLNTCACEREMFVK